MAMMPKRVKYRKTQRGKVRGKATRGNRVSFGEFGLMSLDCGWITGRQIEAGRIAAQHYLGREGKLWKRIFPHKPVSKKPAESRQGKGKGEPEFYVACVRPGTILYEVGGVAENYARDALARTAHKMPIRCKFVRREAAV